MSHHISAELLIRSRPLLQRLLCQGSPPRRPRSRQFPSARLRQILLPPSCSRRQGQTMMICSKNLLVKSLCEYAQTTICSATTLSRHQSPYQHQPRLEFLLDQPHNQLEHRAKHQEQGEEEEEEAGEAMMAALRVAVINKVRRRRHRTHGIVTIRLSRSHRLKLQRRKQLHRRTMYLPVLAGMDLRQFAAIDMLLEVYGSPR